MINTLKSIRALSAALFTIGALAGGANGAVTVHIFNDGTRVTVASAGGTVDFSGMSLAPSSSTFTNTLFLGGFGAVGLTGTAPIGITGGDLAYFDGFSNGNGGTAAGAFSVGDATIVFSQNGVLGGGDDFLFFPASWTAGVNTLNAFSYTTLDGFETSITDLGLVADSSAVWTATSGDTVTILISPIPEPSSAFLVGLGVLGLMANRRRATR